MALVTGLTFAQLLVQFALLRLLARFYGAAGEMDAYAAALAAPVVISTVLAGSLGYVLVPAFAEQLAAGGPRAAAAVTGQVGLYLLGVSLLIAAGLTAGARPLAAALCPGFAAPQIALTAELLRILAVLVAANSLISFLNAVHHCLRQFALPAAAGVFGTLVTLAYVALCHTRQGIHAAAWGVALGAAATNVLLLPAWLAQLRFPEAWRLRALPAVRRCGALLLPLLVGSLCWRFDPLLDRYLGSYLETGSISHLAYAWRLANALSIIGISGLSIVAFPAMAAHAAAGRHTDLAAEFAAAWRLLLVLVVPLAAGLLVGSQPVTKLLFEDGRFGPADTRAVAKLLLIYLAVIVGTGLGDLLSRTLYALRDTRTPAIVGLIGFALAAALKFWLAPNFGAAGLAAATAVYFVLNPALLAAILLRRLGPAMFAGSGLCLLRSAVCAAAACLAAMAVLQTGWSYAVIPAITAGGLIYAAGLWLLGDEFAARVYRTNWRT